MNTPHANEILALGALTGALMEGSPPGVVTIDEMRFATDTEPPRLFVRFPGILKSQYEVKLIQVPDTEE